MIDITSIKLFLLTILGGIFARLTKGDLAFIITALAGITTILYNGIRIYKESKRK